MSIAELDDHADISSGHLCNTLLDFAANEEQLAQSLISAGIDVEDMTIRLQCAAVGAEEGLLPLLRIYNGLKDKGGRHAGTGHRSLGGAGQVIDDRVQQGLDTN